MYSELRGKVVIITGSTSGIGRAIALGFAKKGCKIILNGLEKAEIVKKVMDEVNNVAHTGKDQNSLHPQILFHPANMKKPNEIEDLVNFAVKNFGKIDILINNAGIQHVSPIEDFPTDKWQDIIDINLSACFHMIKYSLPFMMVNGWGRIINIVSAHGLVASPFKSAYVAAKHGLIGLTKTVALETAQKNITCNAICPGYVRTSLVEKQILDQAKAHNIPAEKVVDDIILAPQPIKKFVEMEDIAEAAIFLSLSSARSITGIALPIEGGWTAR
ncbi:MAG: 3-hydroxybutyrate dehydrogenase [Rhodospirillaceae bacterium]|nr:3-hydroxybutyrate dehydrogenase [Rhodospirillaceae bacterium]